MITFKPTVVKKVTKPPELKAYWHVFEPTQDQDGFHLKLKLCGFTFVPDPSIWAIVPYPPEADIPELAEWLHQRGKTIKVQNKPSPYMSPTGEYQRLAFTSDNDTDLIFFKMRWA